LTLHFRNQIDCPPNNISINEITRASQANRSIMHEEYLNEELNYRARVSQTINFEEKVSQYLETYRTAASPVRSRIYHELDRQSTMLKREQRYIINLQDPPEMAARRTFGKGGQRLLTAAERAEKKLKRNDTENIKAGQGILSEIVVLRSETEEKRQEERSSHKRTQTQTSKILTQSISLISPTPSRCSERLRRSRKRLRSS